MNLLQHIKNRGVHNMETIMVTEEGVYFWLYNFSGQMVGYIRYNPNGSKQNHGNKPNENPKYFIWITKGEKNKTEIAPWGLHTVSVKDSLVFIVEGVFDAVKLHNAGVPALAVLSNNPPKHWKAWLRMLPCKKVVIYDNDENGAGKKLASLGDSAFIVPNPWGDVGDMPQEEVNQFVKEIKDKYETSY